jgi:hypothetical protein
MATTHANVRERDAVPRAGGSQAEGQEPAEGLLSMARGRLRTELNARKNLVSDTLDGVADTVRRVGEPLGEHSTSLGGYADQAAGRLKDLAAGLRERDVAELADEVAVFARRYPGAFVAGGFVAGVVTARFLRSTAPDASSGPGAERTRTAVREDQRRAAGARRPARRPSETMQAPRGAEGERHG